MILWADFNECDRHGRVLALRPDNDDLVLDQRVAVHDHEGNSADGVITRLKRGLAYVDIDWDTWQTTETV